MSEAGNWEPFAVPGGQKELRELVAKCCGLMQDQVIGITCVVHWHGRLDSGNRHCSNEILTTEDPADVSRILRLAAAWNDNTIGGE